MTRPNYASSIGGLISQYLDYAKTLMPAGSYGRRCSQLAAFDAFLVETGFSGTDIDEKTVNAWIRSLAPLSDSSIMTYVVAIRKLFEYLSGMRLATCYMPHVRRVPDRYIARYFTDGECASIYGYADDYPCGAHNPLPYIRAELPMVLRILESCGTRMTETISLQMRHVDLQKGVLTMVNTKGGSQRIVPMSKSLSTMLEKYCMAMGIIARPDAYVFPKLDFDTHLEKHDIDNRFSRVLGLCGIHDPNRKKHARGVCPHCFRHNFALKSFKTLEARGIRLNDAVPYLSLYMGHDSLQETEKYLRFSAEMFPEELKRFGDASDRLFPDDNIWDGIYGEVES